MAVAPPLPPGCGRQCARTDRSLLYICRAAFQSIMFCDRPGASSVPPDLPRYPPFSQTTPTTPPHSRRAPSPPGAGRRAAVRHAPTSGRHASAAFPTFRGSTATGAGVPSEPSAPTTRGARHLATGAPPGGRGGPWELFQPREEPAEESRSGAARQMKMWIRGVLFPDCGYPRRAAVHLKLPTPSRRPPCISYGLPATHKYPLPAITHKYKYPPFATFA